MFYEAYTAERFYAEIATEEAARNLIWRCRFGGKEFVCGGCQGELFYQHRSRPEIRTCKGCAKRL